MTILHNGSPRIQLASCVRNNDDLYADCSIGLRSAIETYLFVTKQVSGVEVEEGLELVVNNPQWFSWQDIVGKDWRITPWLMPLWQALVSQYGCNKAFQEGPKNLSNLIKETLDDHIWDFEREPLGEGGYRPRNRWRIVKAQVI